eukprot:597972-Rhodomonas_salina.1
MDLPTSGRHQWPRSHGRNAQKKWLMKSFDANFGGISGNWVTFPLDHGPPPTNKARSRNSKRTSGLPGYPGRNS